MPKEGDKGKPTPKRAKPQKPKKKEAPDQASDEGSSAVDPERREFIAGLKKEILGDLLTTAEVAEVLEVHPRTVGEYIRDGRLLAIQIGGAWRVRVDNLKDFIQGEAPKAPRETIVDKILVESLPGVSKWVRGAVADRPTSMFGRFTDRARRVVVVAQDEARSLNHNYIGTEHLLLGLIEAEGVARKVLERLEIDLDSARDEVLRVTGRGSDVVGGHVPFTPRSKKILELSLREGLQMGHNYVGTEHLLLGLLREGEGLGAQVLVKLGAELDVVRDEVIKVLQFVAKGKDEEAEETPPSAAGDKPPE